MISTIEFCNHYSVEYQFISSLQQQGLIRLQLLDEKEYIDMDELQKIERLVRLHYEMDINIEGIDAISNLLQKVASMHEEIIFLKNKLRNYEEI